MQKAVEQYVLHNQLQFEPIDFKLSTFNGQQVFVARLFPTELVLFDGTKRLLSIIFSDTQEELDGSTPSSISPPVNFSISHMYH